MPHVHDHDHAVHAHAHAHGAPAAGNASRALLVALLLTGGFAIVEAAGAWVAGSLALLSDAGHMVTDAASLGLALLAQRIAARPPSHRASYGYARAEVIAAFVNALLLLALVVFIAVEAVRRLLAPTPVAGGWVLGLAVAGLVVNLIAVAVLSRAVGSLNARGALLHVLSDLLGSVAALVAGLIIWQTGWLRADPLLSLFAALLIVRTGVRVTRESAHVLLEGAPPELHLPGVVAELPRAVSGVLSVHHVHAWSITPGDNLMTLHAVLAPSADADQTLSRIQKWLRETHRIGHVTVQVERQDCEVSADCGADERQ